jgi:hypothetical protein
MVSILGREWERVSCFFCHDDVQVQNDRIEWSEQVQCFQQLTAIKLKRFGNGVRSLSIRVLVLRYSLLFGSLDCLLGAVP